MAWRGPERGQLCIHRFSSADIFQLRFAQLAVSGFAQVLEFFGLQFTHFARFDVEHQRSIAHAADFLDVMPNLFEHLAQLAIATLDDDDFVPGIVALADLANLRGRSLHTARTRFAALNAHPRTQSIQTFFRGLAADLDQVGLLHARCRAGELVGQVAVVGHEQQPFAQVVQPSNRIEALAQLREKLHHGWPLLGIAHRRDKTPRLVEHVVAQALGALQ
jgi:hypothetical protein